MLLLGVQCTEFQPPILVRRQILFKNFVKFYEKIFYELIYSRLFGQQIPVVQVWVAGQLLLPEHAWLALFSFFNGWPCLQTPTFSKFIKLKHGIAVLFIQYNALLCKSELQALRNSLFPVLWNTIERTWACLVSVDARKIRVLQGNHIIYILCYVGWLRTFGSGNFLLLSNCSHIRNYVSSWDKLFGL